MEELKLNLEANSVPEAFGISDERARYLDFQTRLIMHDLQKPNGSDHAVINVNDVLSKYTELGDTYGEKIFMAYVAGCDCNRLRNL